MMTFSDLSKCCDRAPRGLVCEKLTFNQMVGVSEKGRKERSRGVTGPPIDVEAYNGVLYYLFNFKSLENTTKQRHKGYIKFYKPKNSNQSLGKVECDVDCTCPDFRYMYAWAIKQRGSTTVGHNSLNQCLNKAPRIKNPRSVPGLCKHLLSLTKYIMNSMSAFPGTDDDSGSTKLAKLIKRSQKFRTGEWETQQRVASDKLKARATAKAAGVPYQVPPPEPISGTVPDEENNENPTNATNESLVTIKMTNLLAPCIRLLEEVEAEVKKEEQEDGLDLLKSIRNILSDIKEIEADKAEDEEPEVKDLEKEVDELPEPEEPSEKPSENETSRDKEV